MGNSFGTAGTLRVGADRYAVHRVGDLAPPGLPYSLRIVLENLLRHDATGPVDALLAWGSPESFTRAVDLYPARIFLHDTNGVPALADLAAMRDAVAARGGDPASVNPSVPAELVVDHSVVADVFGRPDALTRNVGFEYARNAERYRFIKWGQAALRGFAVVPPGRGIMHQVNVEHLARVVMVDDGWAYPDLCLGTDSHTTMVNGLGVLGWGIGGIEAEAAMLGQPASLLIPRVVGVRLHGALPAGATTTDLVLTITEALRRHGVVGAFVEFYGPGVTAMTVADRVTVANMSPEFGSTCAYFPIDAETIRYLRFTGRPAFRTALVEAYAKEQGLWHEAGAVPRYSETVELDLSTVEPSLAGPRRPQDRVPLARAKARLRQHLLGGGQGRGEGVGPGSVVIAAITSCTNTSNPSVMVGAALLARNAVKRGLRTKPWVKTSLSPGSRVVTDYYDRAGLTPYLETLGFHLTGYGCMTCIGASGPLAPGVADAVRDHHLTVAAVLSGNRNFDRRINPDVRLNYLASPPLVVAYALAGTMNIDLTTEPLGTDHDGRPVHLRDLWPGPREIRDVVDATLTPEMFTRAYADIFTGDDRWRALDAPPGETFAWDDASTYLRRPPYLDGLTPEPPPASDIVGARVLLKLGDSVTTDHISPAGAIPPDSPAGRYLRARGVAVRDLNTYASRRGNHEVMTRGAFTNPGLHNEVGTGAPVHEVALASPGPLIVLAGRDYGAGSSRDWAAKATALLGVRAVLAESFERIHRANLVGMGVLPLELDAADARALTGHETFTITGLGAATATVDTGHARFRARVRLDTPREAEVYRHGGILPYVVRHNGTAFPALPSTG